MKRKTRKKEKKRLAQGIALGERFFREIQKNPRYP